MTLNNLKTSPRLHLMFAAIFIAVFLLLTLPLPTELAKNPDWALQLSGANQAFVGEYPFVDFPSTYGPYVYGATALAQILFGHRIIGELILVSIGFGIGYILLFQMVKDFTHNVKIAWLVLLLGLLMIPALYKYYIVLFPVLSLYVCWNYVNTPTYRSILFCGILSSIAGLFRADFGVYSILACTLTILTMNSFSFSQRLQRLAALLVIVFLISLPTLIWLSFQGGLSSYLHDSIFRTIEFTEGLSKPFPPLSSQDLLHKNNLFRLAVLIALAMPSIAFLATFMELVSNYDKIKIRVAAVWSQLLLLQALHRSDYSHFEQGFTLNLIIIAILLSIILKLAPLKRIILQTTMIVIVLMYAILSVLATPYLSAYPDKRFDAILQYRLDHFSELLLPVDEFIGEVAQYDEDDIIQVANFIKECTDDTDRIATGPNLINLYFMSQRYFRGRMWIAYPLLLNSEDELLTIASYEEFGAPEVFVYTIGFQYDGLGERNPANYIPTLYSYFQENYLVVAQFGNINIAVPREKADTHKCNTQQFSQAHEIDWFANEDK